MRKYLDFFLKPPQTDDFPAHIKLAIEKQQIAGEKLISWALLLIVVIFGTLYFFSPKTSTSTFEPVPCALMAYFVFCVVRLIFSYRQYLPNWFLILSILADVTLLMTLIWSFHLQYHQPPAFYLKAPTLLYIFIFIALRTLRFEAKYVFTVGVFSAIGLGILLFYAIIASPEHASGQDIKPGFGKSEEVAILHCDIRDFTKLSKASSPDITIKLLTPPLSHRLWRCE